MPGINARSAPEARTTRKRKAMKPGDRVKQVGGQHDGKTGAVEWVSGFGTVCNVIWDDGSTAMLKIKVLEKIHTVISEEIGGQSEI